ncbi:hypothetical protein ACI2LC_41885 [Nonomuraea wenchangensis]|uniref:NACHT N-terminal helical domain 7-containing protein n=2 Tax=Nonomuraea wenchangensis TaxID=568860 RepID=UPI00384D30BA
MNREYRYGNALRLLGATDPAIKKLDTLLGLGTLGLWDLTEAKNELIKVLLPVRGQGRPRCRRGARLRVPARHVRSSRVPVVSFLRELATMSGETERWHELVQQLLRGLNTQPDIDVAAQCPRVASPAERYAYYSANLVVLAVSTADQVMASHVLPGREDVHTEWKRYFHLWQSQCTAEEWEAQVQVVSSLPQAKGDDIVLRLAPATSGKESVRPDQGPGSLTMYTRMI